jgi:hypothetical protein
MPVCVRAIGVAAQTVKSYVSCCLAHMLRLFVPDPPLEIAEQKVRAVSVTASSSPLFLQLRLFAHASARLATRFMRHVVPHPLCPRILLPSPRRACVSCLLRGLSSHLCAVMLSLLLRRLLVVLSLRVAVRCCSACFSTVHPRASAVERGGRELPATADAPGIAGGSEVAAAAR